MAKGDHTRSENRQDEQMKQSQGYLTGVQQNLANQYGGFNNFYWGGNQPQVGGTFGYGSTVPHFSWTGNPYYSGNGTDTPTPIGGGSGGYTGNDPQSAIMGILNRYGPASSANLERALPEIQRMFPGTRRDASSGPLDELYIPGIGLRDFIQGAESGNPNPNWTFQGGGGGGGYGGGGLPGMAMQDYGNIMGLYQGMLPQYQNLYKDLRGQYGGFLGSASNMANTGGLSDADKANLRARAISPIRAVYANSLRNVERQRALQGGYSPGYSTLMGRFNRDMGQGVSDATTNAEAAIAEMVQRGKLGGLSAWGSGLGGMASGLLGALGGQNASIGGMNSLFGNQPGMAGLFGNQMLQGMGQQLQAAGLQNQLSLGLMGNQNQVGTIPGNWQNFWGNVAAPGQAIGAYTGALYPWL